MDETQPVVKPTFLEKIKQNKKQLITIGVTIIATIAGIAVVEALKAPADEELTEFDLIVLEPVDNDQPSTIAA